MCDGTKRSRLALLTLGLTFAFASAAGAQAPAVSVHVNGTVVTIDWSSVPGAAGYDVQVGTRSDVADVGVFRLPANQRPLQVNVPPGTYYLRIRGFAGAVVGPYSEIAVVNVGGGSCQGPGAPRLSADTNGGSVTFSWENVPAASAYRLEVSRFPGRTEYSEILPGSATNYSRFVGLVGTFYARLTVGTACGQATSEEISFTLGSAAPPGGGGSGSGPRTPNPPPGQLLPVPGYGVAVVQQVAAAFPGALHNSCGNIEFVLRVVLALRTIDSRWGLNYKRGQRGDLSQDIAVYNPTDRPDEGESQVYLFDIIGGHCGPAPTWNFANVTDATWSARGNPACGTLFCAYWTLDPFRSLGINP
jgi:hypothetical protein